MAETTSEQNAEPSADPVNPGLPEELWGAMLPEHKRFVETIGRAITSNAETIANVAQSRADGINAESTLPLDLPGRSYIEREYDKEHVRLDKLRDDAKALHDAAASAFDKAMWRIVFEHTQKQRLADLEDAAKQRETDRREAKEQRDADARAAQVQRVEDMSIAKRNLRYVVVGLVVGGAVGLAGLIVSILTFVYTFYRSAPGH